MQRQEYALVYEKKGTVMMTVMGLTTLIVGVGVAVLVLIFTGVLSGQVYVQVEPDINAINDTTIQGYVKDAIAAGFKGLKVTGSYMPIMVLAAIIALVLTLILSATRTTTTYATGGWGTAL